MTSKILTNRKPVEPVKIPKIVVGGTLESVLYAICNDFCLLTTRFSKPLNFEFFESSANLSRFKIVNKVKKFKNLKNLESFKEFSFPKLELYDKLIFILSMAGKIINPLNIRMNKERKRGLKLTFRKIGEINVECEELKIFDTHMIPNLRNLEHFEVEKIYEVHDHYKVEKRFKDNFFLDLSHKYDFPSFIYLKDYDIITISKLQEREIKNIDYDYGVLSLIVEQILNDPYDSFSDTLRGVKIETHTIRQTKKNFHIERNDWKFYQFLRLKCEEILDFPEENMNKYVKFLISELFKGSKV